MIEPTRKKVTFLGGSANQIRGFPEGARKDAGQIPKPKATGRAKK